MSNTPMRPAVAGPLEPSVGRPEPKRYEGGRIVGGHSLHAAFDPAKCPREGVQQHIEGIRCGPWRTVDCCGVVDEHDIVECSRCGKQWTVPCSFDEDYS